MVMVKPAGPNLDVLVKVIAAAKSRIDRDKVILETLTGIRRAGAQMVLTYRATEVAQKLFGGVRQPAAPTVTSPSSAQPCWNVSRPRAVTGPTGNTGDEIGMGGDVVGRPHVSSPVRLQGMRPSRWTSASGTWFSMPDEATTTCEGFHPTRKWPSRARNWRVAARCMAPPAGLRPHRLQPTRLRLGAEDDATGVPMTTSGRAVRGRESRDENSLQIGALRQARNQHPSPAHILPRRRTATRPCTSPRDRQRRFRQRFVRRDRDVRRDQAGEGRSMPSGLDTGFRSRPPRCGVRESSSR